MRLRITLASCLFLTLSILYLGFSWSTVLGGFGGDNAYYLMMAQHYSPYSEASAAAEYFYSRSIYPPLFPLLLGLIGGGESLLAAHLCTTAFLLGAFGVFYWWLRQEQIGLATSCFTLVTLALLPGLYLQTLSVHSENLYLLCSLGALACATRASHSRMSQKWILWAMASIAAAYLTRGAGVALIVAALGWIWLNQVPNRIAYSLLAILPTLLWNVFGGATSTNYWGQLVNGYHDPAAMLVQIQVQGQQLLHGWLMNFGAGQSARIAGMLVLLLGSIAAIWRTRLRHMDGLYVWCYWGMIVLWPYPAEAQRMVVILFPVLLWQTTWAFTRLQHTLRAARVMHLAALAILMLAFLPEFALNGARFFNELPPQVPTSYRHTESWYSTDPRSAADNVLFTSVLESELTALNKSVPAGECIWAIKPSLVGYLSGHVSKAPPSMRSAPSQFEAELQAGQCKYFYLLAFASPSFPKVMYPYHRMRERLELLRPALLYTADGREAVAGGLFILR